MFLLIWVLRVVFWGKLALSCSFTRPYEHDALVCAKHHNLSWLSQLLACPG